MRSRNFIPGLLLIVLGAIFLAGNLGAFEFWEYWPVIIILLGVAFFGIWLRERPNYGLLMPASVLTITGILFLYCQINGWYYLEDLWPVFMLAPGVGFFLMYFFGEQEGGLLIPGSTLMVLGLLFMSGNRWVGYWWPVILIVIGVLLLLRPPKTWSVESAGWSSPGDDESQPPENHAGDHAGDPAGAPAADDISSDHPQ